MTIDASDPMVTQLLELLRIPSVSTGQPNLEALAQAAEWCAQRVREAGGTCESVTDYGNPLVLGELSAAREDAPTVLIYGHYDVQSVGERDLWDTDPFGPVIRDGRIWARGASDDKGNFYPLLYAACELARSGDLGCHVRVFVEGEEEAGSEAAMAWMSQDERGADCAIVFDSGSLDPRAPAITIGTRGVMGAVVEVRTAERDVHSGIYGGSVHNATHVLMRTLQAVLPGEGGLLPDALRAGVRAVPAQERASWERFPPGDLVIGVSGAKPLSPDSGERYYERNGFEPSLDVTMLRSGDPRTIVPAVARAYVSIRLAPGQSAAGIRAEVERMVRNGVPEGAEVGFEWHEGSEAAAFDASSPPLRLAREALATVCGTEPLLWRLGASIPILSSFAERGIQTIVSGFAGPSDNIHAPNESYALDSLEQGRKASFELYRRLAELPGGGP